MKIQDIDHNPMIAVDDAVSSLRRIASVCAIMMSVGDSHTMIPAADVAQAMNQIWLCLDEQIEVLDSIQWASEKAVSA